MTRGLVIGKFYPPHQGHKYLIETAVAQVNWLDVIVCARADQVISGAQRVQWLQKIHPSAHVVEVQDFCEDDNSARWADFTREVLGYSPDLVFTSEVYGEHYATLMGSRHVLVDLARSTFSVSATEIRQHPAEWWRWLEPCVRGDLVPRVAVVGAESTGTTTMAHTLASHYRTLWVPEYGREYWENKFAGSGAGLSDMQWTSDEFMHIARTQIAREDAAAAEANRVLICDTDALATSIWHERYLGAIKPTLHSLSLRRDYDLYLLTDCDIPFVQDGTRDGEHVRCWMTERFRAELSARRTPWICLTGEHERRLSDAVGAIDELLALPLCERLSRLSHFQRGRPLV
jgi:HTH-type transcriptional regulator, transcriptional repressor of NAD biosynthesis genes